MDVIYLSYMDLPKILSHNFLLAITKGFPFALRLLHDTSHSNTKFLVKSSIVNILVYMAFFEDKKDL